MTLQECPVHPHSETLSGAAANLRWCRVGGKGRGHLGTAENQSKDTRSESGRRRPKPLHMFVVWVGLHGGVRRTRSKRKSLMNSASLKNYTRGAKLLSNVTQRQRQSVACNCPNRGWCPKAKDTGRGTSPVGQRTAPSHVISLLRGCAH